MLCYIRGWLIFCGGLYKFVVTNMAHTCGILRFAIWPFDFPLHVHWIGKCSCPPLHHLTKSISAVTPVRCPLPLSSYNARPVQCHLYRLNLSLISKLTGSSLNSCLISALFFLIFIVDQYSFQFCQTLSLSSVRVLIAMNRTTLTQLIRTIYITIQHLLMLLSQRTHGTTSWHGHRDGTKDRQALYHQQEYNILVSMPVHGSGECSLHPEHYDLQMKCHCSHLHFA